MACFKVILKIYLCFFNIFLCLVAVAILAGVGYYFYSAEQFKGLTDNDNNPVYTVVPLVVLILVAVTLFILCLLGFIACFYNLNSLAILYAILLAGVIVVQLIGGTLVFSFKDDVLNELSKGFLENMPSYGTNQAYTSAIDAIQSELQCCGVNSYTDWLKSLKFAPKSCCKNPDCITIIPGSIYTEGCVNKLRDVLTNSAAIAISVAIVFALIQISGVVAASILGCHNRSPHPPGYVQIQKSF